MARLQEVVAPSGDVVRRKPQHGDYCWDGEVWRRWSGRRWATAAYSLHPERLMSPTHVDEYPTIDRERGLRALARAVEDQVTSNGASVVHVSPSGVVLGYQRHVSHVFHAVMHLVGLSFGGIVPWASLSDIRRSHCHWAFLVRTPVGADRFHTRWSTPGYDSAFSCRSSPLMRSPVP